MNKLFTKIAALALGATMAVGVGVAVASKQSVEPVNAATETDTYNMSDVISSSYAKYENSDFIVTLGGGGSTVGVNNNNTNWGKLNLSNYSKYAVSPVSTSDYATAVVMKVQKSNVSKMVFAYTTGTNCNKGSIYAIYSSDNTTFTKLTITSGTTQGHTFGGNSETCTFNFDSCTGYFGIVIKLTGSLSSGSNWKYTNCTLSLTYETAPAATLTGLRIASGADTVNKLYEPGQSFDPTGLVVYASWDNVEDTSKNVLSDIIWNNGTALTAGTNKTITGVHSDDAGSTHPVQITGVDVVNPDFTYTYASNSLFEDDQYSTTQTKTYTPASGPEIIHLGGYKYSSGTTQAMSLRNVVGMYVANNAAYAKNIRRIVITVNNNSQYAKVKMYEGNVAGSKVTEINQITSDDKLTLTYNFSDTNQFFRFEETTAYYINMLSFKVFLGTTPAAKVVDTVSIATPGSVYVGKNLQLTATVTYTGGAASDHNVTWRVSAGSGATVDDKGLVTATAATSTTIEAKSVEKNSSGVQVAATVTITPLANPIVSVAWDTSEAKKSYNVGESLSIAGVTATGTNAAGDNDVEIELTEANFSGFDSSEPAASQTITVTYLTFSTTYTIKIVAEPDVYIEPTDFGSGGYDVNNDGLTFDGIDFDIYKAYQNSGGIQIAKLSDGGQFHNIDELGQYITSVEISVKTNSINVYLGTSELTTNSGSQAETVAYGDGVTTITPDSNTYQYIRFSPSSSYCVLNYVKIWYAPFEPAVTLDETSFEMTQGDTGSIEVNATASHFTDDSSVTFVAESSDQSVLDDSDILQDGGSYFAIDKANINPGTTTVTVTGTYATASEEATAAFTITCNAAARNLLSISITTASSDTEFERGVKFTISNLVVTGTFDAAPLTADVTSECSFKLWNGSSESTLTPGTTVLNTTGNFTVRVSHSGSAAAETLTYQIGVFDSSTLTVTQSVIGDSFGYNDTNESSINVTLNANLDSTVDLESYGLYKNGTTIQMNTGKGTYIKNTIAVPGKILRIEMDWTNGTDKNTPTIYFGNSYYATKPTVGGTTATAGESNSVTATGNNSYFYFDGTTVGGSCQMSELRVVYIANDAGAAQNFADKYLLMNTYDQGGSRGSTSGDGTCLTQFDIASTAYGKLTANQKTEFAKLSSAVMRMEDWATANGYTFDATAGTFTQNSRINPITEAFGDSSSVIAIVVIVSVISLTAIGGYIFLRRRKEQ